MPLPDRPPEINIGTSGHVDEGKSTLIKLLTGKFPDEHSEELRRGITIRLGYADCAIYKCPTCPEPECWTIYSKCPSCGKTPELERVVSFVDAPGHSVLMQVMLSGAAIMDGAILVIAANNKVPQPQTREHLAALTALGVKKIVVVQNKVELVSTEAVKQNYEDIKTFLKGTIAEGAPIIPMSAMHGANLDALLSALQYFIPTPERDVTLPMQMRVARSFDINRPGTKPKKLKGGVLGGSIVQGQLHVGDEVIILPGLKKRDGKTMEYVPVKTVVKSLRVGSVNDVEVAGAGGLMAIQTTIDPSMTRSDILAGSIVTAVGSECPVIDGITLKTTLFESVIGAEEETEVKPIIKNEPILLTIGTSSTVAIATEIKGEIEFKLRTQIALGANSNVALSRQFKKRWRLIGYGEIKSYNEVPVNLN